MFHKNQDNHKVTARYRIGVFLCACLAVLLCQSWRLSVALADEVGNGAVSDIPEAEEYALTTIADTSTYVDVTDCGADGTDSEDDRKAIQKALNMAKDTEEVLTVNVPAGTYYISGALTVYSNTNLTLDDNATIIRSNEKAVMLKMGLSDSEDGGGYNRASNITIFGGTWDGNATSANRKAIFDIYHCQDITIENVTIKSCCDYHHIAFHGVKNATVKNCNFSDFVYYGNKMKSALSGEAVHTDETTEDNPGTEPFDGTPCQNITVDGCTFTNCHGGVGNHHNTAVCSNIVVTNNTFTNMTGSCVKESGCDGAIVSGNTAENVRQFCYFYEDSTNVTITDNDVDCGKTKGTSSNSNAIYINSSVADIENNTIMNANQSGIRSLYSDVTILNNTITKSSQYGISAIGCQVNIEDNSVMSNKDYDIYVCDDTSEGILSSGIVVAQYNLKSAVRVTSVAVKLIRYN